MSDSEKVWEPQSAEFQALDAFTRIDLFNRGKVRGAGPPKVGSKSWKTEKPVPPLTSDGHHRRKALRAEYDMRVGDGTLLKMRPELKLELDSLERQFLASEPGRAEAESRPSAKEAEAAAAPGLSNSERVKALRRAIATEESAEKPDWKSIANMTALAAALEAA